MEVTLPVFDAIRRRTQPKVVVIKDTAAPLHDSLFDVPATDFATFGISSLLVLSIAARASVIPTCEPRE